MAGTYNAICQGNEELPLAARKLYEKGLFNTKEIGKGLTVLFGVFRTVDLG
jgi:hypothetical protein